MTNLIVYRTKDGQVEVKLKTADGSAWLSQREIAELFQVTPQAITQHIRAIYEEGELEESATCKQSLQVQLESGREVRRRTKLYCLDMILGVGYRVRSPRGMEFRKWATRHLSEYLGKGFLIDDERLKDPNAWDYFDELLARIREIRASEKRFYQKIRDLFSLSVDYHDRESHAALFFAEVQNKLLYAVTGKTAAELVVSRASASKINMGLTTWQGGRVRKADVVIAKNYLSEDEVDSLNRLVIIFLEQAELRVKERQVLTLDYWRGNVDRMLAFNDLKVLAGTGKVSHDEMKAIAHERYEEFDNKRRKWEAELDDKEDIRVLEMIEGASKRSLGD